MLVASEGTLAGAVVIFRLRALSPSGHSAGNGDQFVSHLARTHASFF